MGAKKREGVRNTYPAAVGEIREPSVIRRPPGEER